jgi:uncharacterized membrane protein
VRHRQAVALLALVGFFVALYLWFYKIGVIGNLQCGSGSCEYVQTSPYGDLFGVPVALYGVVGYAVLFVVALLGLQPGFLSRPGPTRVLAALSSGAVAFTLYLIYIELFVIHAICRWCMASAAITVAIAGAAWWGLRENRRT